MAKTTHNRTKSSRKAKKPARVKRPSNEGFSWRQIPYTQAMLERLANELVSWVRETDSIYLNRFWLDKGMTKGMFEHMLTRSEKLRKAYGYAKETLGIKREEKIHKGDADRHVIAWRQPLYSEEIKEVEQWRSHLREGENKAGAGNYTIEMPSVPTSDAVPLKKKEE